MGREINLLEPLQVYADASTSSLIQNGPLEGEKNEKGAQSAFSAEEREPGDTSREEGILAGEDFKPLDKHQRQQIKKIIEALLFSSSSPIAFSKIREVTDSVAVCRPRLLRELLDELQYEYISQQRAFRLEEIAQGYLLRTCEEYAPYIDLMLRNKRAEKLSQASAEVLAIIAYKQPITRPQIDAIRGVDSSGTVQNLLDRQLIEPLGKLEAPGRPTLYGITKEFLLHFGLRDLKDLPAMAIE